MRKPLWRGRSHTCALKEDKSVECWGKHYDKHYDGYDYVNHIAPSLNNAKALVAGDDHTCALKEDKSVECWGDDDDRPSDSPQPEQCDSPCGGVCITPVRSKRTRALSAGGMMTIGQATAPSLNNATALVAGSSHTCALKEDKSITCWGSHSYRSYFLAPGSSAGNAVIVTNP